MNGIGVSVNIFDVNGARYFDGDKLDTGKIQDNETRSRRMSRTPTLDGGVAVYDTGYSAGDRDIKICVPNASREIADFMAYLVETYNLITVTVGMEAFQGVPSSYSMNKGAAELIINITDDLLE